MSSSLSELYANSSCCSRLLFCWECKYLIKGSDRSHSRSEKEWSRHRGYGGDSSFVDHKLKCLHDWEGVESSNQAPSEEPFSWLCDNSSVLEEICLDFDGRIFLGIINGLCILPHLVTHWCFGRWWLVARSDLCFALLCFTQYHSNYSTWLLAEQCWVVCEY